MSDYENESFISKTKNNIKNEIDKVSTMDNKQKWDYFKSYYLGPTLIILFLLFCLIWFLYDSVFSRKNVIYAGGATSVSFSKDVQKYLSDDLFRYLEGNEGKDEVLFSETISLTYTEEDSYNDQSTDVAIFAMLASGEFNYLLIGKSEIEHFVSMGAFVDISVYAEKYDIALDSCIKDENGIYVAMPLPENVLRNNGITSVNPVYIGFVSVKKTSANDEKFLEYLFR